MDRPIYMFTGFLDSGKTTAIKRALEDPDFTYDERTLILCFEEGDEVYDEGFLNATHSFVEYLDFDEFKPETITELDGKYNPDRIFIEFNGMDDDNIFYDMKLPKGWEIAQTFCMADASKFKLYTLNMPQFVYNHISKVERVVLNRYEGQDFRYLRTNIKSMNQRVEIDIEDADGNADMLPVDNLFDVDNLDISDADYGLFYMDVLDNFPKYKDKEIKFNGFLFEYFENVAVFGRYAMVCCANDVQRLAIKVKRMEDGMTFGSYYHVEGILRIEEEEMGYSIYVEGKSVKEIDKPEQEFVSFN